MPPKKPYPKMPGAPRPNAAAQAAVRGPVPRLTPVKRKPAKKR